jgi:hypothetical protein
LHLYPVVAVMCDDADLTDSAYESIYGHEALEARRRVALDAWKRRVQAQQAKEKELLRQL